MREVGSECEIVDLMGLGGARWAEWPWLILVAIGMLITFRTVLEIGLKRRYTHTFVIGN